MKTFVLSYDGLPGLRRRTLDSRRTLPLLRAFAVSHRPRRVEDVEVATLTTVRTSGCTDRRSWSPLRGLRPLKPNE
jgi:hypothetical protein